MSFVDSWRKTYFDTEHKSDSDRAVLADLKKRKVHTEPGEVVLCNKIDMST